MIREPLQRHEIILMDSAHANTSSKTLTPTSFAELKVKERQDLEEWIKQNPAILGMDLLLISSEFDGFDKTKERLDLLAIDRDGKLVVVELKRDVAGTLADLQAIRYAAFCSAMTFEKAVSLLAAFAKIEKNDAKKKIRDFVEDQEFSTIDKKPRIILAAGRFDDQGVTSCVLWLRSFGVDISCVEITPYRMPDDNRLILVPRVIIPLPEAQDYIIGIEEKDVAEGRPSGMQQWYREKYQLILDRFRELDPVRGSRVTTSQRYLQLPTGRSGVHFEWLFSGSRKEKMLSVEIHFETKSKDMNHKLCAAIGNHKAVLQEKLGEDIHVNPDWTSEWSSVYIERPCEPWSDDIAIWASKKMYALTEMTQPILDEFWSKEKKA